MKKSLVQSLSVVLLMTMATVGYAADKKKTAEKKTENEKNVLLCRFSALSQQKTPKISVLIELSS
ncbi:hypothetical protein ITF56_16305 [Acinetobacter baumannii]|nr:hypothetical protein [Acinetobacter baumannii]